MIRQWQDENFGSGTVEHVEVTLESPVEDDVSGTHAVPSRISRFVIAAGKNDGGERFPMAMPRELLGGGMPHPARCRTPERGV